MRGVSTFEFPIYRGVLHHLSLEVAPDVAAVVDEQLVVLQQNVGRRVLLLHVAHELPQLRAALAYTSGNKNWVK